MVALDKYRPALLLTRESVLDVRNLITVAGITTTARGTGYEVAVDQTHGLDNASVVNCDDVHTVRRDKIGRFVGFLREDQEEELAAALVFAFDLLV